MKQLNTSIIYAGIILIAHVLLMQACSNDVGGNEDTTPSVVTINAIIDANDADGEIIGQATIQWTTDEPNPSTVDIFLSSDSGTTFDTTIALNAPDTGEYVWDTNSVSDCRACRLRIIATDIARNVGGPAESVDDFIINNVPQVLGSAYYQDLNNDGPGNGDSILVPFDKDVELLTAIASDIFFIPVLGDSIGPFATVAKDARQNELVITFNDLANSNFHLHLREVFDQQKLNLTAPSGLNLRDNLAQGILFALDTGRTAAPAENGIDIAPAFSDSGQALSGPVTGGGGNTLAIALGDVDGDGDLDLVTGNVLNFVLLNDGSGVFTDSGQALGNGNTQSVVLGDVDGDGDLDLVTGNSGENRVWLNDGSGVFSDSGQALGNGNTISVALGDVDGDRDLDLVTGNIGENRVWLNNGSGAFTDAGQAPGNGNTSSVALGDVEGDGDLDLVTGNGLVEPNRVWLNDGSGVFSDSGQALGNGNTISVALGDVDGDGDLDLVTGNIGENRVWLNNGSGVFTDSGQVLGNSSTSSVALGDVDGDGDFDLITGNIGENRVWLNNGSGTFSDSGQALGNVGTLDIALGDVDDDGDLDLVTGNSGFDRVWLNSFRSLQTDVFLDSSQALGNGETTSIVLGDVDGDGDLDLITGNVLGLGGSEPNRVWLNNGSGVFTDSGQALGNIGTLSIALGDVDGDGDLDLVTGNIGVNRVWLNSGIGVFADAGQALGSSNTQAVALGDVDGDGDLDLVTGNGSFIGEPNRVWLSNGSGVFADSGQVLGNSATLSIALGDVDGDGDLDLVTGNSVDNRVWLNNGSGTFTDAGQALGNNNTQSVALGDVDGDGDLDLVTGNGREVGLSGLGEDNHVWLNNGSGVYTIAGQVLENDNTKSIALRDVDGDDDLDLVTGNGLVGSDAPNRVWLNNITNRQEQQGVFTEVGKGLGDGDSQSLGFGDVDGDGDLDFVTGNLGNNRVWLNDY